MRTEIVLQHREKNEVSVYQFQMDVSLEVFVDWLVYSVNPVTLNQWYYGDSPTCKPAEDIVPIAIRCDLGEIWKRSEEDIKNVYFKKGEWLLP